MSVQCEMNINDESSNDYWLWWNESKYASVSLSHGMLLSVVVDMQLVHLDGWRSCRSCGLGEVDWLVLLNLTGCVKSGGRVEHGGLCEVDGLMRLCEVVGVAQLAEMLRSGFLSVSRNEKRCSKSPISLSTRRRSRSCSNVISAKVCPQPVTTPRQQCERPTTIFWNFFCLWGWVPILVGHLPISGGIKKYAFSNSLFYLFISFEWSRLIFVVSREIWNIQNVFAIVSLDIKVLSCELSIFLSPNALSLIL